MVYFTVGAEYVPVVITYSLSFIALFIGSVTDLRTREVPDWVNYGLIISGVSLNLLFSVIYSTPYYLVNSIIGMAIFFGFAYIMFYTGQWGGGDSKMMMGLGSMIGIDLSFKTSQFLAGFLVSTLFIGALYGLLWSFFLILKNKHKFWKAFEASLKEKNIANAKKIILSIMVLFILAVFFIEASYIKILIMSLALVILATFYLWIFVKVVEKTSMHRLVEPSELTEGDWIVNNIYVNSQYICGPKDLGIDKDQIKKLIDFYRKGKIKKVLIKEGIPFVPSFFVAFIFTLVIGNPLSFIFPN